MFGICMQMKWEVSHFDSKICIFLYDKNAWLF